MEPKRDRFGISNTITFYCIASMNSKIFLCHKLRRLGVNYDEYRRGHWYQAYHHHIETSKAFVGTKVDISPMDFQFFPLKNLIEYSYNRNDPLCEFFHYYYPHKSEIGAFHNYIQNRLLRDVKRAAPLENEIREVPELYLEYEKIYRENYENI